MTTKASSSKREVAHRRELFIASYAATGNASAAAVAAGYSERSAGTMGDRMMHEVGTAARAREARERDMRATMDDFARQQAALHAAGDAAIEALVAVAANPKASPMARVQAAIGILDRAGHKPIERIETAVQWEDITSELAGIDTAQVLREALLAISQSSGALPRPGDG